MELKRIQNQLAKEFKDTILDFVKIFTRMFCCCGFSIFIVFILLVLLILDYFQLISIHFDKLF